MFEAFIDKYMQFSSKTRSTSFKTLYLWKRGHEWSLYAAKYNILMALFCSKMILFKENLAWPQTKQR